MTLSVFIWVEMRLATPAGARINPCSLAARLKTTRMPPEEEQEEELCQFGTRPRTISSRRGLRSYCIRSWPHTRSYRCTGMIRLLSVVSSSPARQWCGDFLRLILQILVLIFNNPKTWTGFAGGSLGRDQPLRPFRSFVDGISRGVCWVLLLGSLAAKLGG